MAVALVANAWLAALNLRRVTEADARVRHAHQVRETLQGIMSSLQDAETSERGFVITGDVSYLEPYSEGRAIAVGRVDHLATVAEDPAQQYRIATMRRLVQRKLKILDHAIELRRDDAQGFEAARELVLSGEGKRLMDALRGIVAEMDTTYKEVLAEREHTSSVAAKNATLTNLLGVGGNLILLAVAFGVWRSRVRERERAAALLEGEKEKFRTTLTSIGDGVVVTDGRGRVTMLNATAGSLLGWDEGAVGKPLDEVFRTVHEVTREPLENAVRKVLRGGKVAGLASRTVLVRRDGTEIPIDESGAPIRDRGGNIVGVVLVFRDVSERREAERELHRRSALLQEQDRRKDQFMATLSHELRNPLASVHNALTVLRRAQPASDESKRARTIVDRQIRHLTRLVDDLLDVTRIAQGKVRFQKAQVDLVEVVRRTVEDHRSLFANKGISVQLHDREPLWLDADATRLAQVTSNLLQNALKFTNRGGRVDVALENENGRALLRVRDNGVGIDRKTLETLFEPFVQGERTLERTPGGLGLGLALTRSIVELHGGTIQALSDGRDRGAEFVVSLPMLRTVAPVPPAQSATSRSRGRLRICIIDDNEDAAQSLHDVLELEGHEVHVAAEGPAGVDLVLSVSPDVVFCDVGLPGIDGYEVARRLRASKFTSTLVALTGYASSEDVSRALDAGFDQHLPKPTSLDALNATLARAATTLSSARPPAAASTAMCGADTGALAAGSSPNQAAR